MWLIINYQHGTRNHCLRCDLTDLFSTTFLPTPPMFISVILLFYMSFVITVIDAEPPWIQCPENIITPTNKRQGSSNITLSAPVVRDNSGNEVGFILFFFFSSLFLCLSFELLFIQCMIRQWWWLDGGEEPAFIPCYYNTLETHKNWKNKRSELAMAWYVWNLTSVYFFLSWKPVNNNSTVFFCSPSCDLVHGTDSLT